MNSPILEVQKLSIGFCDGLFKPYHKNFVKKISFTLNKGEFLCLVGESGSGKSITARSVVGLLPNNLCCREGRILFEQEDILTKDKYNLFLLRRDSIGFIFQDPTASLNPTLSIKKQLLESFHTLSNKKLSKLSQIKELLALLLFEDINNVLNLYPHQLSGGMKQRICLAMAILKKPKVLIADEPTTALDVTTQFQIIELIQRIRKKYSISILFITHDLALVKNIADRICVMHNGEILETTNKNIFFEKPLHKYSQSLLKVAITKESLSLINEKRESKKKILDIKELSISYRKRSFFTFFKSSDIPAVQNVTFSLYKKHNLAIVGESGSGKTTIAKYLVQLLDLESTKYTTFDIFDCEAKYYSYLERAKNIQLVFQGLYTSLDHKMRIYDILMYPMKTHFKKNSSKSLLNRIFETLELVQLPRNILDRYPHEFSGGQCQRIAIARSLLLEPKILVCDEITSSLDISTQMSLLDLLKDIQKYREVTYLFITHDLYVAKNICHEIIVMNEGKIEEYASTTDIFTNPQSRYTKNLINSSPSLLC